MVMTFSQVAREIAEKYASPLTIKEALDALGAKAEHPLDDHDAERRLHMTSQFVRSLRNVGVAEAHRIEHELFTALGATPTGRRAVVVKDAISLITVRNHVHQLATALGLPWSAGMQLQSAVSEVARFVSSNGGGRIETEALADGRIHFEVWTHRPLGPVSMGLATPVWLVGVSKLCEGFRSRSAGGGTHLQFWTGGAAALVA